jgi:NitT/TauT family transport system substrate-binding protein
MKRLKFRAVLLFVTAALGMATCVSASATVRAHGGKKALTDVSCRMGFTWGSGLYYSTYLIGVKKGIYAKYGLNVTFKEGTGSVATMGLIANGDSEFGCAVGTGSVISVDSAGAKVKMIAGTEPFSTLTIMSLKDRNPIRTPKDMIGKTIAFSSGGEQAAYWPAFLEKVGISASQVKVVNLPGNAFVPALAAGQIDAFIASSLQEPVIQIATGDPAVGLTFASAGILYRPLEGIVASESLIASQPGLVKRFLAAVRQSMLYAIQNPVETAKYYESLHPENDLRAVLAQTGQTTRWFKQQGGPFAHLSNATWNQAISLSANLAGVKNTGPPSQYYDGRFVAKFLTKPYQLKPKPKKKGG